MTEEQDMYQSHEYKMLQKACADGDEAKIREWYTQISMGYGHGMMEREIGTIESLISSNCK